MNDNGNIAGPSAVPDSAQPPLAPAGFWVRSGAFFLDVVLIALPVHLITRNSPQNNLITGGLFTAYCTIMVGARGQTLGKMFAGVTVVSADGSRMNYSRAFTRACMNNVSGMMLGVGYLIAAFTPGKRALHDYVANTRAVYLHPVSIARKAVSILMPAILFAGTIGGIAGLFFIPKLGLPVFRTYCEHGGAAACSLVGTIYKQGKGTPKDSSRALLFYQKACDGGNATGCSSARKLREEGVDGGAETSDPAKTTSQAENPAVPSAALYKQACDAKVAASCNSLGGMYQKGLGVKKNPDIAAEMFQQACGLGDGSGCANLAALYIKVRGLKNDNPQVTALFKDGCEKGSYTGCFNLGAVYYNMKDYPKAGIYLAHGCKMGYKQSCTLLERIDGRRAQ